MKLLSKWLNQKQTVRPYLIIGMKHRRPDFHYIYSRVAEKVDADVITVNKRQLRQLEKQLEAVPLELYHGAWFDLSFKYLHSCVDQLKRSKHTVFYEQDVVQNDIHTSTWHDKFTEFYCQLPNITVLTTGQHATNLLKKNLVQAVTSIKGYDPELIYREPSIKRDITAGFIGSTSSLVYKERKEVLETLENSGYIKILREVEYGKPYRDALNRIKIFVSADINLKEYMAKNFEAMACGCALIAYRQGNNEEARLGLKHGVNCLLYEDAGELQSHIANLAQDEKRRIDIAEAGYQLATTAFGFDRIASDICHNLLGAERT